MFLRTVFFFAHSSASSFSAFFAVDALSVNVSVSQSSNLSPTPLPTLPASAPLPTQSTTCFANRGAAAIVCPKPAPNTGATTLCNPNSLSWFKSSATPNAALAAISPANQAPFCKVVLPKPPGVKKLAAFNASNAISLFVMSSPFLLRSLTFGASTFSFNHEATGCSFLYSS